MKRPGPRATPSALRTLLRRRGFEKIEDVVAWSRREYTDSRYHLYPGLFSRIEQGKMPTVYRLEAVRAAAAVSRQDLYALAGIDLDLLPRHSSILHQRRTRPLQSRPRFSSRPLAVPDRFSDSSVPAATAPLSNIVAAWSQQEPSVLEHWRHDPPPACLYVQVGLGDGMSYPEIAPGMVVQVDADDTASIDDGRLYAFEHPYGYSVCRAAIEEEDAIVLLSSSRGLYPELTFPRSLVRVLGRARACCGRIVDIRVPSPVREADLRRVYRDERAHVPLVPPLTAVDRTSASEVLGIQRRRLGISYEEFAAMTRQLREMASAPFSVSAARLHELIHGKPTLVQRPAVVYALAACFALEFEDVLATLGVDVGATLPEHVTQPRERPAHGPAQLPGDHPFAADLLARWLEWPPILPLLGPDVRTSSIFYLNQPIGSIEPLIKPHAFLLIDGRQTTIATVVNGRPVAELPEWERPIYLLLTRQGYVCGYCERDERAISIVAHPKAADQRRRTFPVQEVDIVGRVAGVATLL